MTAILAGFRERLNDDFPILCALVCSWVFVLLFLWRKGVAGLQWIPWTQNLKLYLFALGVIAIVMGARQLYLYRPASPFRYLARYATDPAFVIGLVGGLPMLAAMIMYIPIFSAVKTAIPLFTTYTWDPVLIAADRMMFGTDAWRVLQPVLGFPLVTSALSFAYHAWVVLLYGSGIFFCFFVQDRELRAQYFVARFLIWIVMGMIMASGFASVGPCFVAPITGNHHYDEQMAYLRMANTHYPVLVLPVQDQLLAWFREGDQNLGAGISAMPSLHVGMTALTMLAARRISRVAGACLFLYLLVILVGSVHLGYHYAIDGFVAIAATLALWLISGSIARKITVLVKPLAAAARPPPEYGRARWRTRLHSASLFPPQRPPVATTRR